MSAVQQFVTKRKRTLLPLALAALGLVLMGLGWADGEALDIRDKAVVVCLGCIGLG